MENNNPLNITSRKDPVFREKQEPVIKVNETYFTEGDNSPRTNLTGEMGWKYFSIYDKDTKEFMGNINYDYPKENSEPVIRIRGSVIEEKYRGQNLAIQLYEKLIEKAKSENFDGIASDASVQAGALAVWKKLMDKGYNITVDPAVVEEWKTFLETYNEGKMFKKNIRVDPKESVFKILFRNQEK
jgi:GNAT superfamily N-acetyltransferase